MASTFCSRCGDAIEEDCDPRDGLAELDALLERLTLRRYDLKRKISRLSTIVRQLPSDVMSTIYEFCLPDFADRHLYPYPEIDLSIPSSLGAICKCWREITWITPSLESSLVVRVPSNHFWKFTKMEIRISEASSLFIFNCTSRTYPPSREHQGTPTKATCMDSLRP